MKNYNLCLMGFGNVNKALVKLLEQKKPELRERYGIEYKITGVSTRRMGFMSRLKGVNTQAMIEGGPDTTLSLSKVSFDVTDWLAASEADMVLEAMPLNPTDGQPALDYLLEALEAGVHVVSANKGPVVHGYNRLRDLAAAKGKRFLHESTVMDGTPIFSLFRETLPAANLLAFRGILNSTTNYILTEIENGKSYDAAVKGAQAIGIAETDPSADVDGWDAAVKVAALRTVLMGIPTTPQQIDREGIRGLSPEAIRAARAEGKPYKLVCRADRKVGSVKPEQLPLTDPLASVTGTSSIIHFETDIISGLTVTGHNPGPMTTAYGMLADFVNAVRE
jgi:homoserine dehydrogenase